MLLPPSSPVGGEGTRDQGYVICVVNMLKEQAVLHYKVVRICGIENAMGATRSIYVGRSYDTEIPNI